MAETTVVPCPNCATRFSAPLEKFLPDGRQVRCSNCGHTWFHRPPGLKAHAAEVQELEDPELEGRQYRAGEATFRKEVGGSGKSSGGWLNTLLWLLALLLLLAIVAYVFRPQLSKQFPGLSAPLASFAGKVDGAANAILGRDSDEFGELPFRIDSTRYDVKAGEDGQTVLVEASVTNANEEASAAPRLRVRLVDENGQSVFETEIGPEDESVEEIAAGATQRYFSSIADAPEDFRNVLVDFVP